MPTQALQLLSNFQGDHLSVKMFGAKGDGVTDDTVAIQKAIAYSAAQPAARELFFPAGTYIISATLSTVVNLTLTGEGGRQSTTIKYTGSGVAIDVIGAGFANAVVTLRNLTIKGTAASVAVTNATNATPIVITAASSFATGTSVSLYNVAGNTAAVGTFVVTNVDATHFSLNGSVGNGAYTSGGTAQLASIGIRYGHNTTANFNGFLRLSNVYITVFDKGLELRNSLWLSLERCELSFNPGYGIYCDPQDFFTTTWINDTRVSNNGIGGLFTSSTSGAGGSGQSSSSFTFMGGNIETNGMPQVVTGGVKNIQVRFIGTHFESQLVGRSLDISGSRGVAIENCYFNVQGGNVIYSSGGTETLLLSNLTMFSGGRTTGVAPVLIEGANNQQVTVQSCFFDGAPVISADTVVWNNNSTTSAWDNLTSTPYNRQAAVSSSHYAASHVGDTTDTSGFMGCGIRQNYLTYSQDLSQAAWVMGGAGSAKGATNGTAPDGTATANTITLGVTDATMAQFTAQDTNGKLMTFSYWARTVDGSNRKLVGTLYNTRGDSNPVFTVIGPTWKRYSVTRQFSTGVVGVVYAAVNVRSEEAASFDLMVWGLQLNDGGLQGYAQTTSAAITDTVPTLWNENGIGRARFTGITNILDGTMTGVGTWTIKAGVSQGTAPMLDFRNYFNQQNGKLSQYSSDVWMLQLGMFRAEGVAAPSTGAGLEVGYDPVNHWGNINVYNRGGAAAYPLALQHTGGNTVIGAAGSSDDGVNKVQVFGTLKATQVIVTGIAASRPARTDSASQLTTGQVNLGVATDVAGTGLTANTITKWDGTKLINATSADTTLPNVGTAGTYTKVTTDAQGRVSAGATADLSGADVTGVLAAARFPALTGDITTASGALATTLKNTGTAGVYSLCQTDAQGRVVGGSNNGISVVVNTAKLTAGGANGTQTFTNGLLTAQVQAT